MAPLPSLVLAFFLLSACLPAAEIILPDDPKAVFNAREDGGAVGDGVADDTDALQAAIETSAGWPTRILYLPKGIYRITRPLVLKKRGDGTERWMVGPWIYGQDRDATIIRLDDGAEGFGDPANPKAIIEGLARPPGAKMNADFFDRTMVNLTIDTGRNEGAIGIRFYSNNTGLMQQVAVKGEGSVGIDLGSHDQNGPLLIQDVTVEGFAIGVSTAHGLNSQTLSRVTVIAREVGLRVHGQVVAAEALTLRAPVAVTCDDRAVLTLVDGAFENPGEGGAAMQVGDRTILAVQRLSASGFTSAISFPDGRSTGATVAEFTSHAPETLGERTPPAALGIAPQSEPEIPFPTRAEDWVCANDFGAIMGDGKDDGPALQKAIDAAADQGASAVYLRSVAGGDKNWYTINTPVRIHGSVRRLMGFGFVRIVGGSCDGTDYPDNLVGLVIDDDPAAARVITVQHLKQFDPALSLAFDLRSTQRILVLRSVEGTLIARPGTRVYASNMAGTAAIAAKTVAFFRQWNTERTPRGGIRTNTLNNGGALWILGMKTESAGTKLTTQAGGRSEVLGVHNYNTHGVKDDTPFFRVTDATLSVSGYREINFTGGPWRVPAIATHGGVETRSRPWRSLALCRTGE